MWFELMDTKGEKHLINFDNVSDVIYHEESNLTEILYLRSAIAPIWVNGNVLIKIKTALNAVYSVRNIGG